MGRTNSNLGVYGCSIDGEVTWHTAQSQENVYQVSEAMGDSAPNESIDRFLSLTNR